MLGPETGALAGRPGAVRGSGRQNDAHRRRHVARRDRRPALGSAPGGRRRPAGSPRAHRAASAEASAARTKIARPRRVGAGGHARAAGGFVSGLKLSSVPPGRTAHYNPRSGVSIARSPSSWSSQRSTILQEFGHAFAHRSGVICLPPTGGQPSDEPVKAMDQDRPALQSRSPTDAMEFARKNFSGPILNRSDAGASFPT